MKKISKILVPTDFSEGSEEAAIFATELAKTFGAKIRLLHVIGLNTIHMYGDAMFWTGPEFEGKVKDSAKAEMDKFVTKLRFDEKPEVSLELFSGAIAQRITADAAENKIDLVVMSTHGRTGLDRIFLGSVTERVLRTSPCPVLILPKETKKKH